MNFCLIFFYSDLTYTGCLKTLYIFQSISLHTIPRDAHSPCRGPCLFVGV